MNLEIIQLMIATHHRLAEERMQNECDINWVRGIQWQKEEERERENERGNACDQKQSGLLRIPGIDLSKARVSASLKLHSFSLAASFTRYLDFRFVMGIA